MEKEKDQFEANKFECSLCYKTLASNDSRRKHILQKHFKHKPFICEICNKSFKIESSLQNHKRIHDDKPIYNCICGKEYKIYSSYYDHLKRMHIAVSDVGFECHVCGKNFTDNHGLKIHKLAVHGDKTFLCSHPSCGKMFSTISLLNSHKRYHIEKKHTCKTCGKTFRKFSYLEKHILAHQGVKPHKCLECGKAYLTMSSFNQHRKRAHQGSNFFCSICGKGMKTKEQLTQHEMAHKGEKPYACSLCDYRTSYSGALSSHKKVHRKNNMLLQANDDLKKENVKNIDDFGKEYYVPVSVVEGREKDSLKNIEKNKTNSSNSQEKEILSCPKSGPPLCGENCNENLISSEVATTSSQIYPPKSITSPFNLNMCNEILSEFQELSNSINGVGVISNTHSNEKMFENNLMTNSVGIIDCGYDSENNQNLLSPFEEIIPAVYECIVSPKSFLSREDYPNTSFSSLKSKSPFTIVSSSDMHRGCNSSELLQKHD